MRLPIYQIDAFAQRPFSGNPAAVCPLEYWPEDSLLQQIAEENNLSETAFFVAEHGRYRLRWFTPAEEVDLCGHATLASAHVLFTHLGYRSAEIVFITRSGELTVRQTGNGMTMDFPVSVPRPIDPPAGLIEGLGCQPVEVLSAFDYVVVLEDEEQVRALEPDFSSWMNLDLRGVVVTAAGKEADFVSRCFFPKLRVNEDPVTGSAHCETAPYWSEKLARTTLTATQLSARSGTMTCQLKGNRIELTGQCADYMQGEIILSN
jgi:PhzF family phenazine biosynthesis protein